MPLPILYQDNDLVVVNKTSGLLVHRSSIALDATEFALQMVREQIGRPVFPVHRLDRATSGALIFALSQESARSLGQQFIAGEVDKTYVAVVRGTVVDELLLDYPLKEELDPVADRRARKDKPAQQAITQFSKLASCELPVMVDKYPTSRYSLVKARPVTGRKHQIRRHLRHLGHPIVGDITYGTGKHNRFFESQFKIRRLLLACVEVGFTHPTSRAKISVHAPLAEDFQRLLTELGWEHAIQ